MLNGRRLQRIHQHGRETKACGTMLETLRTAERFRGEIKDSRYGKKLIGLGVKGGPNM